MNKIDKFSCGLLFVTWLSWVLRLAAEKSWYMLALYVFGSATGFVFRSLLNNKNKKE